ncbi:hypothetical protein [Calycomorphotria hydatis]|uniref:Immunoglobulin G-binding protein A n=1 Tax=Calycomorphotria hydatis TaxID=2528027 RepID=A0A517T477_9PLAN|nr:hypothetical protein [Calycomorphotria hydatis]QDT63177.1 Immunoglobulin G-binding protein A precursor [Calycomorphotria hydatis]
MKTTWGLTFLVAALALTLIAEPVYPRGGMRGGGGGGRGGFGGGGGRSIGGGGGGARIGGGGGARPNIGGGGARPNIGGGNRASIGSGGARPNIGGGSHSSIGNRSPSLSKPNFNRPTTLPSNKIGGGSSIGSGNRPNIGSGNRPSIGGGNKPNIGGGNRPSIGGGDRPNIGSGNRPNIGGGDRPNIGSGNRPNIGGGNRPDLGGGRPSRDQLNNFLDPGRTRPSTRPGNTRPNLPDGGLANLPGAGGNLSDRFKDRPTTLPGQLPGGGNRPGIGDGNRPGIGDGNRPGIGNGNRPGIGDGNRPGIGDGNRPGIGDGNRPGIGDGNRPGIGNGNRPGIGDGNRPGIGDGNRPGFGGGNRPNIGNQIGDRNNVAINIRNDFSKHWNNNSHRWNNFPGYGNGRWDHGGDHWHYHSGWNRYRPGYWWGFASAASLGTWFTWGAWTQPRYCTYGYGGNVYYQGDTVYVNDTTYTATQYYDQAATLATDVPQVTDQQAEEIEWMPLGVFAIANESAQVAHAYLQLAVSKDGVIAGTYYNEQTDASRPIQGSVDEETQRAAWTFADGKNTDIVMETALMNLTQDQSTALVHFGSEQTQTWMMVRLPDPKDDNSGS